MGDERLVKLLLENGAAPDFEDEGGQTPLSRAVERGSVAVVQLLLSKEVKTDYKYNIRVFYGGGFASEPIHISMGLY